MVGAAEHLDKQLEVLRRSARVINREKMEIDADTRHVPQLLVDLELIRGSIVKTPRVKLSATEPEPTENSPYLDGEQATNFRSGTMATPGCKEGTQAETSAQDCVPPHDRDAMCHNMRSKGNDARHLKPNGGFSAELLRRVRGS